MDIGMVIILLIAAGLVVFLLTWIFGTPKLTHAGAVVRRGAPGSYQYLLVSPKGGGDKWVIPKGTIEPGEDAESSALRELHEEAGVRGSIIGDLGVHEVYKWGFKKILVHYFLVLPIDAEGRSKEHRKKIWLSYKEALQVNMPNALKSVLAEASRHT